MVWTYNKHLQSLTDFLEFIKSTKIVPRNKDLIKRGNKIKEQFTKDLPFLLISLIGGTGVGKSQMINAFVGEDISTSSPVRTFTEHKVFYIYHAYGETLKHLNIFQEGDRIVTHKSEEFKDLVLVDLPDLDGCLKNHRNQVDLMIRNTDITVWVVDYNKYNDASMHEKYLQPLWNQQDSFLFVLNKIDELIKYSGENASKELREISDDFVETLQKKDNIKVQHKDVFKVSAKNAFARKMDPSLRHLPLGEWERLEALVFDSRKLKARKYSKYVREAEALIREVLDEIPGTSRESVRECLVYLDDFLSDFIKDIQPIILPTQSIERLSLRFLSLIREGYTKNSFSLLFEPISISWLKGILNLNNQENAENLVGYTGESQEKKDRLLEETKESTRPNINQEVLRNFLEIRKSWLTSTLKAKVGSVNQKKVSQILGILQKELNNLIPLYWDKLDEDARKWKCYSWKQWLAPSLVLAFIFTEVFYFIRMPSASGGAMFLPNIIQSFIIYIPLSYIAGILFIRKSIKKRLASWRKDMQTNFEDSVRRVFIEYCKDELEKEVITVNNAREFLKKTLKNFQ